MALPDDDRILEEFRAGLEAWLELEEPPALPAVQAPPAFVLLDVPLGDDGIGQVPQVRGVFLRAEPAWDALDREAERLGCAGEIVQRDPEEPGAFDRFREAGGSLVVAAAGYVREVDGGQHHRALLLLVGLHLA